MIKKYKTLLLSIKITVICFLILFVYLNPVYLLTIQDRNLVQHHIIRDALYKWFDEKKQIPQTIEDLASLKNANYNPHNDTISSVIKYQRTYHGFEYYPESWNRPGKILLQSSLSGSYVVTFGDGCQAVLYRWYDRELNNKPKRLFATASLSTKYPLIISIIILCTIIIIEFFIKRIEKQNMCK